MLLNPARASVLELIRKPMRVNAPSTNWLIAIAVSLSALSWLVAQTSASNVRRRPPWQIAQNRARDASSFTAKANSQAGVSASSFLTSTNRRQAQTSEAGRRLAVCQTAPISSITPLPVSTSSPAPRQLARQRFIAGRPLSPTRLITCRQSFGDRP